MVHRDIKPQNIIISKEGKVKVADFGIARAVSQTTTIDNYSQNIGSVHYLSPEQARGGFSDERSDIYSLGVTLYEMLAGHVPFTGDNAVSVALLHVHGEAQPLSEVNPTVPSSIEKIVEKCMQKKPERRYMTTNELITDLKKAIVDPEGDFVKIATVMDGAKTRPITPGEMSEIKAEVAVQSDSFDDDDEFEDEEANRQKAAATLASKRRRRDEDDDDDDDEDLDTMGGNTEKFVIALSVLLVIAVAVGAIYLITKIVSGGIKLPEPKGLILTPTSTPTPKPSTTPTPKVFYMPSYKGLDYNVAIEKLEALDMKLSITYEAATQYYEDFPVSGQVVGQIPGVGEGLKEGDSVRLIYSIGKEQIDIPDFRGMTEQQVRSTLGNKLSVRIDWVESDSVEENRVVDTQPRAGEKLPLGSTLIVILSQGNSRVTDVPDVVGMKEVDAKVQLVAAKLNYQSEVVFSDTIEAGVVISQSPTASAGKVERGSIVKLVVSGGVAPTATPTPEPLPTDTPTPEPATPTPTPEPAPATATPTPEPPPATATPTPEPPPATATPTPEPPPET